MEKRVSVTKKQKTITTPDENYFMGDKLEVSLLRDSKGSWRVMVWGPDDIGMELSGNLEICLDVYNQISDGLGMTRLKSLGFVQA